MNEFENAANSFGLGAIRAAADPPTYDELEKHHPGLVRQLSGFEPIQSMMAVSGLLTMPGFHANTARLEILQTFIQRNSKGRAAPTRRRLEQWLNQELLNGWAGQMEDPVEDVFVSNVITGYGNNRIFEGVWEANDFWAQEALAALYSLPRDKWRETVMENCCSLLRLSEAVADRCQLNRNHIGGGEVRKHLDLQSQEAVINRSKVVCFSPAELEAVGIFSASLETFIHPPIQATGAFGKSSLDRRPLIRASDKILLSIPAAVSVAVRLYIAEELIGSGSLDQYQQNLAAKQASKVFNEGRIGVKAEIMENPALPPIPDGMPITAHEILKFDHGKYAHVVFLPDSVSAFRETQVTGLLDLLSDGSGVVEFCESCALEITKHPEFTGGLTVAVVGGLGRAFTFGQSPIDKWHPVTFRLPDFLMLGRIPDVDLLLIWNLHEQKEEMGKHQIGLRNLNGELNLIGYWKSQNQRLVPRWISPGESIRVPTNALVMLRNTSRLNYDYHAVLRLNPNAWIPVRRLIAEAYFQESIHTPIFVDEQVALKAKLRGVAETPNRGWWVSTQPGPAEENVSDTLHRIWDCVLQWMPKIAQVAEANLAGLIHGPIEFVLDCNSLAEWSSRNLNDLPAPQELIVGINEKTSSILLRMPLGFVRHFVQTDNVAERKIIRACLIGACRLSGLSDFVDQLEQLVDQVAVNTRARFFHVAEADSFREYRGGDYAHRAQFVSEGQTNFYAFGLANRLLAANSATFKSLTRAKDLFHLVVDDSWMRLRTLLEEFDLESVIERALQNVEAIEHDKEQWRLTASALFAIHSDAEDVLRAAREEDGKRNRAEIVSRIAVEMAICTCPREGGRKIGAFELGQLLSLINLLLFAAKCSDAVQYDFVEENIEVYPNGEFSIDESYMDKIIHPYVREHFSEEFNEAAQRYHEYYKQRDSQSDGGALRPSPFDPAMVRAFVDEYGLTPDDVINAGVILGRDALEDYSMVVRRTVSQLHQILIEGGLAVESAKRFLSSFALWPRDNWDSAPEGFANKDWYPWRFRRRLSLVARPLVQLGFDDTSKVYYAPGQIEASVQLLITRLMRGELPAEDFRSGLMRSWIGEATRMRGAEFEKEVADECARLGLKTLLSRPMTEFGAEDTYGDLDVIAWTADESQVLLIEAKCLRCARTVAEIGEQLREFRGVEKDRLNRHIRRCEWLKRNTERFSKAVKMQHSPTSMIPVLVTNTTVPMRFTSDLPLPPSSITSLKTLNSWVESNLSIH
jgi:hypothetical protein